MAFGSDVNAKSCFPAASSRRPRAPYSSFVSSLRRVDFFVCLWLVTQFVGLVARTSLQGFKLRPCSGILLAGLHLPPICSTRLSTDLRVLSAGTRDFCLLAMLPGTGPLLLTYQPAKEEAVLP